MSEALDVDELLDGIRTFNVDVFFISTDNPDFWKIEGKEFEDFNEYVKYVESILQKFERNEVTNGDISTIIILLTFSKIKVICLDFGGYPSVVVKNE
jgi:hypothetical protein